MRVVAAATSTIRTTDGEEAQKLNETIGQIPQPVLVTAFAFWFAVVLLLIVLFAWLRARGGFMFIDCIVKNRGAIVEPWSDFVQKETAFSFSHCSSCFAPADLSQGLLSLPLVYPSDSER